MSERLFKYLETLTAKAWRMDTRNAWEKACTPLLMFFYGKRLEAHLARLRLERRTTFLRDRVRQLERQRDSLRDLSLLQALWLKDLGQVPEDNPYITTLDGMGPHHVPEVLDCTGAGGLLSLSDEEFLRCADGEVIND